MKISLPTRTALGDPTQSCPPDPAADLTITALAGSGGGIGTGPKGAAAAGAVSSSCVTRQQYAMRHKSNATCTLRRETKIVVLVVIGAIGREFEICIQGSRCASRILISLRLRF
jgi:hypothetical protein